jgi:transmembrane sensor
MTGATQRQEEREALEREAARWISKLSLDGASDSDIAALKAWRDQSPAHAAAFSAAARTWRSLDPVLVAARREEALALDLPRPRPAAFARRAVLGGLLGAGAAAAAAVLMVRPPFRLWPSLSELDADYRTGVGQRRTISIGTVASVELNTETSITVHPAAAGDPAIELIAGEVVVSKSGQSAVEFAVIAGDGRATAREATFNVRRDGAAVCVTCIKGEVRVAHGARSLALGMGQQVSYTAGATATPVAVDPGVVTAWRDGMLVFHDQPLARVIDEVNRYRAGRIILLNAALGRRLVTARFELGQLDDVIVQMNRVFGAHVTTLPGGIVLLS